MRNTCRSWLMGWWDGWWVMLNGGVGRFHTGMDESRCYRCYGDHFRPVGFRWLKNDDDEDLGVLLNSRTPTFCGQTGQTSGLTRIAKSSIEADTLNETKFRSSTFLLAGTNNLHLMSLMLLNLTFVLMNDKISSSVVWGWRRSGVGG